MANYLIRDDEDERLKALHELAIVGTEPTPEIDAVVGMACELCDAPSAMISLIDSDTQWYYAGRNASVSPVARDHSFCNHAIYQGETLVVEDASRDGRFVENPMVTAEDGLRFYAGSPIFEPSGNAIGTLCIFASEPRTLSDRQCQALDDLAAIASTLILQRRDSLRVQRLAQMASEYNAKLLEQSRELMVQKRMLDDASDLGQMGAFDHDMRTGKLRWSESIKRIHEVEYDDDYFTREYDFSILRRFYSKRELARYLKAMREAQRTRSQVDIELVLNTAKGRKRWVRVRVDYEYEDGVPVRRFGMMQDISHQRRMLNRLNYLATRDPLTGLFNRNYFQRQADAFLKAAAGTARGVALIDLDGFKSINDSYGHAAGDACLKAIARRLRAYCGKGSMLIRPGGDEFKVVFSLPATLTETTTYFETLREIIQQPIRWKETTFQVSASIGVAPFRPGRPLAAMDLVQEADLAVYKAKAAGRNCVAFYSSDLYQTALHRFKVIAKAREGLAAGAFELFYQPKIVLADGSPHGFEALLRRRMPDGTYATPGDFMAALEDPEMSRRLGDFVVETALRQASAWRKAGFDFGHIAVNVASSQFVGISFVDKLIQRLDAAGLHAGDIQIEVTEGVLLSTGATAVTSSLQRLSDCGIKIAFDDFGTGYASLVHLRQLEFDIIKLDMSFVQSMLTSNADMAIVQAVLMLATQLGKKVVAEGVETEMQRDMLRSFGCHYGQGYLFSRPKHPDDILAEWRLAAETRPATVRLAS